MFDDLPKDVIKIIFGYVLHSETLITINKMKLLSKRICNSINESSTLYHGKYISWWYNTILKKGKGFRNSRLRRSPSCGTPFTEKPYIPPLNPYDRDDVPDGWWWYDTFSDYAIRLKYQEPQIRRYMDSYDSNRNEM